jgi:hypothetical protein
MALNFFVGMSVRVLNKNKRSGNYDTEEDEIVNPYTETATSTIPDHLTAM